MNKKPSIGRSVHYRLGEGPNRGKLRPATITEVFSDTCVNLTVLTCESDQLGLLHRPTSVQLGNDGAHDRWTWPEYVPEGRSEGKAGS